MNRDEMLKKLHSVRISVALTALVSEDALECEYVTSEGTKYEWISLCDWPAYSLRLPANFDLELLKQKLSNGMCDNSAIAETNIEKLYSNYWSTVDDSVTLDAFLAPLANISSIDNNTLYSLFTEDGVLFFGSYRQFEEAFEKYFGHGVTPWETYSDSELAKWLERIECEFDGIALAYYED